MMTTLNSIEVKEAFKIVTSMPTLVTPPYLLAIIVIDNISRAVDTVKIEHKEKDEQPQIL